MSDRKTLQERIDDADGSDLGSSDDNDNHDTR